MSRKNLSDSLKTWTIIDSSAALNNYRIFRKLLSEETKLFSVVKSNAYGHGLIFFSKFLDRFGIDGFCVDSVIEGLKLREARIKKLILVLGPTLDGLLKDAARRNITVTVSNFEALKLLASEKRPPAFHLKFDTGMHRQGFYLEDARKIIKLLHSTFHILNSRLSGLYTHFAAAKDLNDVAYTERQFSNFQEICRLFENAGYKNLVKHTAATGGALLSEKYHLDAVRIGIGLYGFLPSPEMARQFKGMGLRPVLSWQAKISEIKKLSKGDYVGYDLTERVIRNSKIAVLPVGYWHGLSRSLSSVGEALVKGKRARILGRVSMDLTIIDVTGINCRVGDVATILGRSGGKELYAPDVAEKSGTTHYEFLTRLNPLMKRIVR